jgi:hypothetical protein
MRDYTLYKNAIQYDTLAIVQYMHSKGIDARPNACIERCHPQWATKLPSIETSDGTRYVGLNACIEFYESVADERDLLHKATVFKAAYSDYRIQDVLARQ